MQIPMQISFRGMEPSAAVEARVRERAARLERFFERIQSCRVVVEVPHRHHHQGKRYRVRIDLKVPGGELAASREPAERQAHEDVYVAMRDAFDAVQRQLANYVRRQRSVLKTPEAPSAPGA